jgi:MFS family permease
MILGSSVAGIDSTVVAVALPAIGQNLHASFEALQWTVTGYTLTLAALIQTPVPHLACPVAVPRAPGQTRRPNGSQVS